MKKIIGIIFMFVFMTLNSFSADTDLVKEYSNTMKEQYEVLQDILKDKHIAKKIISKKAYKRLITIYKSQKHYNKNYHDINNMLSSDLISNDFILSEIYKNEMLTESLNLINECIIYYKKV